jgi:hypothetical protein
LRFDTLAIGAVLIIIGAIVQTFTKGGDPMLAGRFVVGLGASFEGIGKSSRSNRSPPRFEQPKLMTNLFYRSPQGAAPYVTEISHPRNRPQATALINTCWFSTS